MRDVVIVEAARTPVGRFRGGLKSVRADHMGAAVLQSLVQRAGITPGQVDDVVFGCVSQVGEQCGNIARTALLSAGWPFSRRNSARATNSTCLRSASHASPSASCCAFARSRSDAVNIGWRRSASRRVFCARWARSSSPSVESTAYHATRNTTTPTPTEVRKRLFSCQ